MFETESCDTKTWCEGGGEEHLICYLYGLICDLLNHWFNIVNLNSFNGFGDTYRRPILGSLVPLFWNAVAVASGFQS